MRIRLLINGLIILSGVGLGVWVTQAPWRVYQKQSDQTKVQVKAMNDAEKHRVDLLTQADREESRIGREETARKEGYIGPGEVAQSAGAPSSATH